MTHQPASNKMLDTVVKIIDSCNKKGTSVIVRTGVSQVWYLEQYNIKTHESSCLVVAGGGQQHCSFSIAPLAPVTSKTLVSYDS